MRMTTYNAELKMSMSDKGGGFDLHPSGLDSFRLLSHGEDCEDCNGGREDEEKDL